MPVSSGPGGRSRGPKERIRTAKGRTTASQSWIARQLADPYVHAAKREGYRSRAAYKLIELDERFGFLKGARKVLDLGAAPGGWSQVVRKQRPQATLVGIDILPVEPMDGAIFLLADITADGTAAALMEALGGRADLVLSDMAANTVGHQRTDHLRTMGLVEAALDLAEDCLAPGGAFVAKVLAGGADTSLVARLKQGFTSVKHAKPPASRKESSEWYVVALGWKGSAAPLP